MENPKIKSLERYIYATFLFIEKISEADLLFNETERTVAERIRKQVDYRVDDWTTFEVISNIFLIDHKGELGPLISREIINML